MLKTINNKTKKMNTSFKVALIYFVVGVFWMFSSGKLLEFILHDKVLIERVKTFENIIFIILTSVMIYFLVFKFNKEQKEVIEKLESNEVAKKTFVESLPFAIFEKDSKFVYRSTNEYYKEYAKMKDVQLIGKSDYEIFDRDVANNYRAEDEKMVRDKKTINYSEVIVSKDTSKIYNVIKTPFFEKGEVKGIIGVIIDITETRRKEVLAEQELKTMNLELEERVRLRTEELFNTNEFLEQSMGELEEQQAELTILNDQLETSLEELQNTQEQLIMSEKLAALGELVAGVAHEINTPLGISVTLSTFIKEKHRDLKEAFLKNELKRTTMKEYVDSIDEAIELMVINLYRASELVTSFKQVATDQSTLEIRKFNVNSYINEVLLSLHPRLKKTTHKIEVICDKNLKMIGYPGALSQVITNLVMNSLIHGFENKKNGLMKIEISVKEDIMNFKYSDNGIGVKEEDLENIYKPFYTTKRNSGSTGLGMHIIHNIVVQILNGKIDFKSHVDEGVQVIIEFPLLKYEEIQR